ncbi:hypothetical protein M0802_012943, partial [Mischocyttarus mexicanus]
LLLLLLFKLINLTGTIGKVIITGTCREISKAVPLVEEKIKNYSGNEINQKFGQIDKSYVKPPLKFLDMAGMGPDIHVHVIITSIVNPKSFFIQVCALHNLEYDDLQNEMQEFYNNSTNLKMLELFDDKNIGTALLKEKLAVKENSIKKYYLEIPKSDSNQLEECSEQYKMYKQFQNELDEEFEEKPNVEELESDDDEGFEIGDHIDLATLLSTTGNNKIQDYLPSDFNLNQSSLNNDEV